MGLNEIRLAFPNLDSSVFQVTSPDTDKYNCIAYAAGDTDRWWWPDAHRQCYWPPSAPRHRTLPAFQAAFESINYIVSSLNGDFAINEYIAIFHKNSIPKHAMRQLPSGAWTSKLGEMVDIRHGIDCMNGNSYGEIAFFMKRLR